MRYTEDFKKTIVALHHDGQTQLRLSEDYGVAHSTIHKWIKLYSEVETDNGEILTAKQVRKLQKQVALLKEENLIFKKSNCHIHAPLKQRLKAIELLKSKHKISRLCKALNVNRSTYYNSLNRQPSKRDVENQKIRSHLLELYIKHNKRLGAIKLNRRLFVEYGISISLGRVYRLLKSMPLPRMSTVKPSFKSSKHSNDEDCTNHLNQEFSPSEPNKVWVSDFTYIKTSMGFRYFCVIMDLYSRKIIA